MDKTYEMSGAENPNVISIMMTLQENFDLPVEINVSGEEVEGLTPYTISTCLSDEFLRWFAQSANVIYLARECSDEIDFDDL